MRGRTDEPASGRRLCTGCVGETAFSAQVPRMDHRQSTRNIGFQTDVYVGLDEKVVGTP